MAKKSMFITYFLWLIGGIFGLHHFYLERDIQCFLCWCTLGGYFGFGWLRDIFYIPSYVRDANQEPKSVADLTQKLRTHKKPPFSTSRFTSMIAMGYLFGSLLSLATPEDNIAGYSVQWVKLLIPFAISLGVWSVGNIGHEQGTLLWPLVGAYCICPFYINSDGDTVFTVMVIFSAVAFEYKSKQWRRRVTSKKGFFRRVSLLTVCGLIYLSLWGSYIYFNAKIKDADGEEIPIHEALHHFFRSPWWMDLKKSLGDTWEFAKANGWSATWKLIVELSDPHGEQNAYKVLGLSSSANQTEINSVCRMLSVKWHPDKVKDPAEKQIAQEKFYEIQQACEILSKNKAKRRRKNKLYDTD